MYYVYLLKSKKHDFTYVGSTPDLRQRVSNHNLGKVRSTKFYAPFQLIYYEAYLDKYDALKREKRLKHHGGAIGHLKKRLKNSLTSPRTLDKFVSHRHERKALSMITNVIFEDCLKSAAHQSKVRGIDGTECARIKKK